MHYRVIVMSEIIEADPESIRELSDELQSSLTAMTGTLDMLTGELNYLMNQWTGEAADAYLAAQSGWTEAMDSITDVLFKTTALLSTIATRYETTESAIVDLCGA
jgi:WXG100 family type VII secretion target